MDGVSANPTPVDTPGPPSYNGPTNPLDQHGKDARPMDLPPLPEVDPEERESAESPPHADGIIDFRRQMTRLWLHLKITEYWNDGVMEYGGGRRTKAISN